MYIILLNIASNKGCGVWATTIECQNAFVSIQCCALCGGQNKCDYKPNARAQSVFCAFHTFFVEVQTNGYIHARHA